MEVFSLTGEEVAAPGEGLSGAAGTGQKETIAIDAAAGTDRRKYRVKFPVLHYFGVRTKIRGTKREYNNSRALACRGERG